MRHHPSRRLCASTPPLIRYELNATWILTLSFPRPTNPASPSALPIQYFFDVVLVPLLAITYLLTILYHRVAGLTARAARLQQRRSRVSRVPLGPADANAVKSRPWIRNSIVAGYYVLIAGMLATESGGVVRFVQSRIGIGLVPFVYGRCVAVVSLRATKGGGKREG